MRTLQGTSVFPNSEYLEESQCTRGAHEEDQDRGYSKHYNVIFYSIEHDIDNVCVAGLTDFGCDLSDDEWAKVTQCHGDTRSVERQRSNTRVLCTITLVIVCCRQCTTTRVIEHNAIQCRRAQACDDKFNT